MKCSSETNDFFIQFFSANQQHTVHLVKSDSWMKDSFEYFAVTKTYSRTSVANSQTNDIFWPSPFNRSERLTNSSTWISLNIYTHTHTHTHTHTQHIKAYRERSWWRKEISRHKCQLKEVKIEGGFFFFYPRWTTFGEEIEILKMGRGCDFLFLVWL